MAKAVQALKNAKVLVTGATGFLGRHLTRALVENGIDPVLMMRPGVPVPTGRQAVHATLSDKDALQRAVTETKPDVIFHLAAQTNPARETDQTWSVIKENFDATIALAEAAKETGVSRFVFTGTCEEYGRQQAPFSEDLAPAPVSPYSASKAAATFWLKMLHDTHGFPAVILRPFLVYGPGQAPPKLVPSAMKSALAGQDFDMTSGTQHRELTYVGDVVDGMIRAAIAPKAIGQILNLGSGEEHRVVDLVQRIYGLVDAQGSPRPGALKDRANELQHFCADTTRAAEILDWRAQTSLEHGLLETLNWMRAQGDTPVPL